ncbi:MAG TPA: helix-turn-helix transcriptional regulator [Saprospiraceae bacterium]|nr:helix-turn-helix transcriptional regulator [Saprospiraceae bacterium]HPN68148.1 helix-turn-helix transcriptional regulator [Saprospiraceae bacterium]
MALLRVKEIMTNQGVSGVELSRILGVTPATVSNIVNGTHFPKPDLLKSIASALEVDIRELFVPTKESQPLDIIAKEKHRIISNIEGYQSEINRELQELKSII